VQGAQGTQGVQGATGSSGGSGTIVLKQLIDQSSSDNTTWISSTYLTTSALTVGIRYYYKAFLFCSADVVDDMNILYAGNLVNLPSALDNHAAGVAGDLFYRRDSDGITYRSLNFATGGAGMMISEGIFELSSGTSFTVRFRKNTDSTAIDSKLLRGSYLEITEIG
jgi:HKD family nuclease